MQYYTASSLSGDAFFRVCKTDIELLTVREHLDIAEAMLRVGISSVFSKRLAQANNKFMEGFDNEKPSTFLWLIDANNLYGGIMEQYPLPLNSFVTTSNATFQTVLETEADSEIGYIVELNTEKRKRAENKFEEDVYKLLSNSAYGEHVNGYGTESTFR